MNTVALFYSYPNDTAHEKSVPRWGAFSLSMKYFSVFCKNSFCKSGVLRVIESKRE